MNGLQKKLTLLTLKSFNREIVDEKTGEVTNEPLFYGIYFADLAKGNVLDSDIYSATFASDFVSDVDFSGAVFDSFPTFLVTFDLVSKADVATDFNGDAKAKVSQKILVHSIEII